ncbi:hypothetical protein HU200_001020 [Digitaria exilis]|uniref:F-box domain-containing protein n=1 Tax=Digitaria exilis TaxID=1010633 RepID=A0A835L0M9_9POAL|nr:hypothetical protein HU200_001020 [Digitaria exilis]
MEVQTTKKKCVSCLPEEMLEQILVRLPASTLLRCRRVCKKWNSIIRDPQFIMAHLQQAPRCPLIFFPRESRSKKLYPSEAILFDEDWAPSNWNASVIEPDDLLSASCNGLVCLYSDKTTIKIANVATGEFLHLAKPVTKEYKVIRFPCERRSFPVGNVNFIQVYTLGDDKWRNVRSPKAQILDYEIRPGVINVGGAMYWLVDDKESSWGCTVVSFDLNEEHFEWIRMPNHNDLYRTGVFVVKLEIWTLDNKIDQSWSRKYNIQLPSLHVRIPNHFFIYGDKIAIYDCHRNMYFHKLMGQSIEIEDSKMVKLLNYGSRFDTMLQSYVHVKSLVGLHAYSRAGNGIVRRPKQLEAWGLKKWEKWTLDLSSLMKRWINIHQFEHLITV